MRKIILLLSFLLLISLPACADVILVTTPDVDSITPLAVDGIGPNALAVAWYLPSAATDVNVAVEFTDLFGAGIFSAFLMNGIGPQADPLVNEIASATFGASMDLSTQFLWHSLSLDPGVYYLVMGTADPDSVGGWGATTNPLVTLGPGVQQGDGFALQFYASGLDVNLAYLPGSNFVPDTDLVSGQLMYQVTVPEPATGLLLGAGLLAMLFVRRRR